MSNKKHSERNSAEPKTGRSKAGFSLALKINSRLMGRLFWLMILLNILFLLVFGDYVRREIEHAGMPALSAFVEGTPAADLDLPEAFSISEMGAQSERWKLPSLFKDALAGSEATNVQSYFNVSPSYRTYFTYENTKWCFAYDLSKEVAFIQMWGIRLLIIEAIVFVLAMIFGANTIRRSLKPIAEMERATRVLRESTPEELSRLAGRIRTIDATDLDTRLPVNNTQEELKGLAESINGLLERIDEAYRSQARFVSDASHELRTPIAVIQGYANLLDRWGKEDEKTLQESINAIKSEADNMKDLVEQLLFLARGDNESMAINIEEFDLSVLADEVFRESRMIDSVHDLRLKLGGSVSVRADVGLMKQAMRILIDNSIKYTMPGERITVRTGIEGDKGFFSVQDNGIGIVPEDLPYIFDRFYRSDESRARKTGGTGLGLAIAKWIVHRHGGHMEVVSRKDVGTRITAYLPLYRGYRGEM